MKKCIALLIFTSTLSFAGEIGVEIIYPQWVYEALASTFPEFNEHLGGFSAQVSLKELSCSSGSDYQDESTTIAVNCKATDWNGRTIEREGTKLFLALLNSQMPIDHRVPGESKIVAQDLNCAVIAPRPADPEESWPIEEYRCTYY